MATKFQELMANYAKIKQFPMDGNLMPLADPKKVSSQPSSKGPAPYREEHPGPIPQPPKGFKPQE